MIIWIDGAFGAGKTQAGVMLPEDGRSRPRRAFERIVTQIRHIR